MVANVPTCCCPWSKKASKEKTSMERKSSTDILYATLREVSNPHTSTKPAPAKPHHTWLRLPSLALLLPLFLPYLGSLALRSSVPGNESRLPSEAGCKKLTDTRC